MYNLDKKLECRINDKFYGYIVNSKMKNLSESEQKERATGYLLYQQTQKYLQNGYNLTENNMPKKLSVLSLEKVFFWRIYKAVEPCKLDKVIDMYSYMNNFVQS